MNSISHFRKMKSKAEKISMVTCYDYTSAKIVNNSQIDAILVGDSAAMVMHGFSTTVNASVEMLRSHVSAVHRGAPDKFIIADIPFLAHRKGLPALMETVDILMKAGAQAVKLEGIRGYKDLVVHIVESGIPVMGHLGLTPQSIHKIGGYIVQGRQNGAAERLCEDARELQDAGCFALVLELIPAPLAKQITEELTIPTIGVGSGPHTSGQILVFQDLLGMNPDFKPRFLRTYLDGYDQIITALDQYTQDVKENHFPNANESFPE